MKLFHLSVSRGCTVEKKNGHHSIQHTFTSTALVADNRSVACPADRKTQPEIRRRRMSDRRPDVFFQREVRRWSIATRLFRNIPSSLPSLVPLWRLITEKAQTVVPSSSPLPLSITPASTQTIHTLSPPFYSTSPSSAVSPLLFLHRGGRRNAMSDIISARRQGGNGVSGRHRAFPAIQRRCRKGKGEEAKGPARYEQVSTGLPVTCAHPDDQSVSPRHSLPALGHEDTLRRSPAP